MKNAILLILFAAISNLVTAQNLCDSTLMLCDSVHLNTIQFSQSQENGDRIHLNMTTNHHFLYAPSVLFCPDNQEVELVNYRFSYFSIYGPSTMTPFFEFTNFEIVGDSLSGSIVVTNIDGVGNNCMIGFETAVNPVKTGVYDSFSESIRVYPNPSSDAITITTDGQNKSVTKVKMYDSSGKQQSVNLLNCLLVKLMFLV